MFVIRNQVGLNLLYKKKGVSFPSDIAPKRPGQHVEAATGIDCASAPLYVVTIDEYLFLIGYIFDGLL
jgi:hypothetical protein